MPRRELHTMLPEDIEYLDKAFPDWESVSSGRWILLPNFSICSGYTFSMVTAAIKLPNNYPVVQLDMVYFFPALERKDGVMINAINTKEMIDGKEFQRWSRHYQQGHWTPESRIEHHILAIKNWLEREFIPGKGMR